jgi:hypothetical protein
MNEKKETEAQDFTTATKLEEIDRLRLEVMTERERRLGAEIENCQMALGKLRDEQVQHQVLKSGFSKEFREKYGLTPTDVVNQANGDIRRAGTVRIVKHEKKEDAQEIEPKPAPVEAKPAASA